MIDRALDGTNMETRRQFFGKIAGVLALGLIALKGRVALAKKLAIGLDKVPTLQEVGGSARVKLNGKEVLLIRDSATSVRGLSPFCTHQNCIVNYDAKSGELDCPCHNSVFALTGAVVKGPAIKPLTSYPASLADNRIVIEVS